MPTLKINVAISGKWKLDGQNIKHVIRGAVWTGVAAGGIWLATHWPAPLTTDIQPPLETPVCRTTAPTIDTWCLEGRLHIEHTSSSLHVPDIRSVIAPVTKRFQRSRSVAQRLGREVQDAE